MPRAKVYITYKEGVVDPQGLAIRGALKSLGFREVQEVRVGKFIEIGLEGSSMDQLRSRLRSMCERLLANPVIEDYRYELEEEVTGGPGGGGRNSLSSPFPDPTATTTATTGSMRSWVRRFASFGIRRRTWGT